MLEGWARLIHRWRWAVLGLGALSLAASLTVLSQGVRPPEGRSFIDTESHRANDLIRGEFPPPPVAAPTTSFTAIFSSGHLTATDPRFRDAVLTALEPVRADPRVTGIHTPYDVPAAAAATLISRGGDRVMALVTIGDSLNSARRYWPELRALLRSDALDVLTTGSLPIEAAFDDTLERDLQRAEYVAIPLALVLLLLVFGSVVAALLPIAVGVLAMLAGLAGVVALSRVSDVSSYDNNIVTLIGLGVAIDYSLFIVQRFRDELARGRSVEDALARAMATAGRAIAFSGATVAIGLSGMLFYGSEFSSVGESGALVVAFAVGYAFTVLPALLAVLGPRVGAWRVPVVHRVGGGMWRGLARAVMARPLLVLMPTATLILAAGTPFLHMRLATGGVTALPPQDEARRGYDVAVNEFPGQDQTRLPVVIHFLEGTSAGRSADVADLAAAMRGIPDVLRVEGPDIGPHVAVLAAFTSRPPTSEEARTLVRSIRALAPPRGGEILVDGRTATDMDTVAFIAGQTPGAVAYVALTTAFVLFLLLGSVVLPVKAVLMNVLSIAGSFGALVWIFQDGHLSDAFNFTPQSLDPVLPVILFCIVFGLSMDYEVLLLSRMQEEYDRTHDNRAAVAEGLERSGRLITGAAAIMVGVFTAFALAEVVFVKSVGVGLALAVALDATVVRALVVPATMRLLGDLNWWAPRPLARLRRRPVAAES